MEKTPLEWSRGILTKIPKRVTFQDVPTGWGLILLSVSSKILGNIHDRENEERNSQGTEFRQER